MNECQEVAHCIAINLPPPAKLTCFDDALAYVRTIIKEESETVLSNVAQALWEELRAS